MDVGVNVMEDGTASMTAKMSISEDLYLLISQDTGTEDNEESLDPSKFVKETIDGETYYSYSEIKEYDSYDGLIADLRTFEISEGMLLFDVVQVDKNQDGEYMFMVTTAIVDTPSEDAVDMDLPDDWLSLTMSVKMPGEVTEVVGGEKLEDGTIRFSLNDFSQKKELYIRSEVSRFNITRSVIVGVVGLTIIAIVITTHFRQKKRAEKAVNENAEN